MATSLTGMDVVEKIGSADVEPGPPRETDGIPRSPITINSIQRKQQHSVFTEKNMCRIITSLTVKLPS
ncbi:MAG: hypothetical protein IPM83_15735 [Ignavibacteria bacterium]|nr:hypothetical protein [Ignavibacteria bacterium]